MCHVAHNECVLLRMFLQLLPLQSHARPMIHINGSVASAMCVELGLGKNLSAEAAFDQLLASREKKLQKVVSDKWSP